jgi:hypothetical protein
LSPSVSPSLSPSISPSLSPSTALENYTRGDYADLPGNDNNLETNFSAQDYLDVNLDDGNRVNQTASGEYAIFQFKDLVGDVNSCSVRWNGQSTLAPNTPAIVFLQVYNQTGTTWQTIASEVLSGSDTDFDLTFTLNDLTVYKTAEKTISCRVYQRAV